MSGLVNEHTVAVERARAYLKRLPPEMEASGTIRGLLAALEQEQYERGEAAKAVEFLNGQLDLIAGLASQRDDLPPAWKG